MTMLYNFVQVETSTHRCSCGCASRCVGAPLSDAVPGSRMTPYGRPACELCGVRLSTVKHKRPHGPGYACSPRCKPSKRPVSEATAVAAAPAAAAAPLMSKKRRAASDPGEPPSPRMQPLTRRITPSQPSSSQKKQKRTTRADDRIARLLDETHARRMAAVSASSTSAAAAHQ
jgi:hypothetical protein